MYGIIGYIRIQAVLILLLTGTVRSLFSQQDAFIKILDNGLGGFGGPQYKLTQINGSYALVSGGPHGIMINPDWGVFASANYLEFDVDGLEMGFGAIGGEYNFFPGRFLQFSASVQAGYGGITYHRFEHSSEYKSGFWVLEPELDIKFRVMEPFRINAGVGYRKVWLTDDVRDIGNRELSGIGYFLRLQYGIFHVHRQQDWYKGRKRHTIISGFYSMKFTSLDHQLAVLDGGGTRVILNKNIIIGATGYTSRMTPLEHSGLPLSMGYGGLMAGYIFHPESEVHLSLNGVMAFGGLAIGDRQADEITSATFFVFEPDGFLNFNLMEFMRVGIGAGYRFTTGVNDMDGLDVWEVNGITGTIQLRFGGF